MTSAPSDIFEIEGGVYPPEQVFKNTDFDFSITSGGHLVEDEVQYQALMTLLKEIGEQSFTIRENLAASVTERTTPFVTTIKVDSTLDDFNERISEFDPNFGMMPWQWFVQGNSDSWGIYVSEWPTVIIVGCKPELTNKFRTVFNINDNGHEDLKEFLEDEFEISKDTDAKRKFLDNYKIETTTR